MGPELVTVPDEGDRRSVSCPPAGSQDVTSGAGRHHVSTVNVLGTHRPGDDRGVAGTVTHVAAVLQVRLFSSLLESCRCPCRRTGWVVQGCRRIIPGMTEYAQSYFISGRWCAGNRRRTAQGSRTTMGGDRTGQSNGTCSAVRCMAIPASHQVAPAGGITRGLGYVPRSLHQGPLGVAVILLTLDRVVRRVAGIKVLAHVQHILSRRMGRCRTKRPQGCTNKSAGVVARPGSVTESAVAVVTVQALVDHDCRGIGLDGIACQISAEPGRTGIGGSAGPAAGTGATPGDALNGGAGIRVTQLHIAVAVETGGAAGGITLHVADDAIPLGNCAASGPLVRPGVGKFEGDGPAGLTCQRRTRGDGTNGYDTLVASHAVATFYRAVDVQSAVSLSQEASGRSEVLVATVTGAGCCFAAMGTGGCPGSRRVAMTEAAVVGWATGHGAAGPDRGAQRTARITLRHLCTMAVDGAGDVWCGGAAPRPGCADRKG